MTSNDVPATMTGIPVAAEFFGVRRKLLIISFSRRWRFSLAHMATSEGQSRQLAGAWRTQRRA